MHRPDVRRLSPATLNRRQILRLATGTTAAGLLGILHTRIPPLYAAERTLTMLTWNHFNPAADDYLKQMAQSFGQVQRCQVKIDFIPHRDTYIKVAKELQT